MFTVTVRPGVVARLLLRVAAAVLRVADLAHEAVLGRPRVDERAEDSRERFVPRMAARGRRGLAVVARLASALKSAQFFFFSVVKRAKTGFSSTRGKSVSSRRERAVSHTAP